MKAGAMLLLAMASLSHAPAAELKSPVSNSTSNTISATAKVFQAVKAGDVTLLRAAIAEGGDVNDRDANGLPPLLALLRNEGGPLNEAERQCVACLLENGADVDAKDELQRTPLVHAARLGDLETIKVLVDGEAYVKTRDKLNKTALFYAVESGRRDIVLYLASHGDLVSLTIKERKQLAKH